ncbi:response regulator [Pedobacter sp. ISL-68]|uniref:response regulator n=1 Tax=unclassified Pedobacter TaxID=2628915 RepID=UPI001BE7C710|nr:MULTISPECIES: response regulator [unclassified Pedobacter]MBT2563110.1 response regulator [Pedobacter sp. ISL-64]MBT2593448.1 response regulator [Pedobacter sp. ISL-68]
MKRIIVQDSNEAILEVLKPALEMENFKVFTFSICDEGFLTEIDHIQPHVILLDDKFTWEAGIKICNNIKNKYPLIPLLVLSFDRNIRQKYQLRGFDGYVTKPFDLQFLYDLLAKYIKDFNA